MYYCVLCLIVVPLPPDKNPFAVQLNNNNIHCCSVGAVLEITDILDSRVFWHRLHMQNYWVSGLCPSFGILTNRKHSVSESGYVSVFR
jgi:hypothetical protein